MTDVATAQLGAPRPQIHVKRLLAWAVAIAVLWVAVDAFGWDVHAWFRQLWEAISGVAPSYIAAGIVLQTLAIIGVILAAYGIPGGTKLVRESYREAKKHAHAPQRISKDADGVLASHGQDETV